jgi:hypothetical protein
MDQSAASYKGQLEYLGGACRVRVVLQKPNCAPEVSFGPWESEQRAKARIAALRDGVAALGEKHGNVTKIVSRDLPPLTVDGAWTAFYEDVLKASEPIAPGELAERRKMFVSGMVAGIGLVAAAADHLPDDEAANCVADAMAAAANELTKG